MLSLHEISALLLAQHAPDQVLKSKADTEFLVAAGLLERTPSSDRQVGVKLTEKGRDTLRRLEHLGISCENDNGLLWSAFKKV